MLQYAAIRKTTVHTESRVKDEEFLDFSSFADTIEESLSKARSNAELLSSLEFDVEALQPIVRITRVEIKEV